MDSYEFKTNNVVDALNDVYAELAGESAGKEADTVLEALNNIAVELELESAPYSNTANAVRDIGLKLGEAGGGSGSDAFIVTFTYGETYGDYTADKTWQDVYDAMEDGKLIIGIFTNPDAAYGFVRYCPCTSVYHHTGSDLQSLIAYAAEFGGFIRCHSTTPSDYLYAESAY